MTGRRLTYGQVGGAIGSFIGHVHRAAIAMNNQADIVAGVFSRDYDKNLKTAEDVGIPKDRVYRTFEDMAEKESRRDDPIDFVVISAPNNVHYAASRLFLESGINVVCEKPLSFRSDEAVELVRIAESRGLEFMVTYTYTGYPMVREIRDMIRRGDIGSIRVVVAEYPQGYLADSVEATGYKRKWKLDPAYTGPSLCLGDIGTHIESTVHFMTGLNISRVLAKMDVVVPGRKLDDNDYILVEYEGGATGNYWSSKIAIGIINGLRIRIFGEEGAIEWLQEEPEVVRFTKKNGNTQLLVKGKNGLESVYNRIPAGHPEGYFEAFSNLYKDYCSVLIAKKEGRAVSDRLFPTVVDGARGVKFVEDCIRSSREGSVWVDVRFSL